MKIFASMTTTLHNAYADPLFMAAVQDAEAQFVFSCLPEHVFRGPDEAPYELSWLTDASYTQPFVRVSDQPEPVQNFWEEFKHVIAIADDENRVWWGAGRGTHDRGDMYPDVDLCSMPAVKERLRADGHDVVDSRH